MTLEEALDEIDRLRALIQLARRDLLEHVADGDCTGPDGTPRQSACEKCMVARDLDPTPYTEGPQVTDIALTLSRAPSDGPYEIVHLKKRPG